MLATCSGIFASIKEIYRNEGLSGFLTGLVPRWLGEIMALIVSSLVIYGVNNYIIDDKELKTFAGASIKVIVVLLFTGQFIIFVLFEVALFQALD